jgi:hypothetical protein
MKFTVRRCKAAQWITCLGAQNKVDTIWPGSQSTAKVNPPVKTKSTKWMTRGQGNTGMPARVVGTSIYI